MQPGKFRFVSGGAAGTPGSRARLSGKCARLVLRPRGRWPPPLPGWAGRPRRCRTLAPPGFSRCPGEVGEPALALLLWESDRHVTALTIRALAVRPTDLSPSQR